MNRLMNFPIQSHCRLSRLGRATFAALDLVEVLHLRGNRFRRLDRRAFAAMGALKSLTLEGNPWLCDCNMDWLLSINQVQTGPEISTGSQLCTSHSNPFILAENQRLPQNIGSRSGPV